MKKRLVLLPILSMFALSGCDFSFESLMFWKKKDSSSNSGNNSQTPSGTPSDTNPSGTTDGTTYRATVPTAPSGMSLLAEVSGHAMQDLAFKGYDNCAGDHTVGGYTVNFNGGVQINGDPAGKNNKDRFFVIQWAKKGHEKAADGGTLTVKNIQPKKVIVQAFMKTTYSWNNKQLGTVQMGGSAVTVPGTSTTETTEYSADYKIHTVTLDVNAASAGDFTINDSNNFAIYLAFVGFYA